MTKLNNVKTIINGSLELNIQQTKESHVAEGSLGLSLEESTASMAFTGVTVTDKHVAEMGEFDKAAQSKINAQYDQSATTADQLVIL